MLNVSNVFLGNIEHLNCMCNVCLLICIYINARDDTGWFRVGYRTSTELRLLIRSYPPPKRDTSSMCWLWFQHFRIVTRPCNALLLSIPFIISKVFVLLYGYSTTSYQYVHVCSWADEKIRLHINGCIIDMITNLQFRNQHLPWLGTGYINKLQVKSGGFSIRHATDTHLRYLSTLNYYVVTYQLSDLRLHSRFVTGIIVWPLHVYCTVWWDGIGRPALNPKIRYRIRW